MENWKTKEENGNFDHECYTFGAVVSRTNTLDLFIAQDSTAMIPLSSKQHFPQHIAAPLTLLENNAVLKFLKYIKFYYHWLFLFVFGLIVFVTSH